VLTVSKLVTTRAMIITCFVVWQEERVIVAKSVL